MCDDELTIVDVDTEETVTLDDNTLIVDKTNITFLTQSLRENRRYNVTITASNVAGSALSETRMLVQ